MFVVIGIASVMYMVLKKVCPQGLKLLTGGRGELKVKCYIKMEKLQKALRSFNLRSVFLIDRT